MLEVQVSKVIYILYSYLSFSFFLHLSVSELGVIVHAFSPRTQQTKGGGTL